MTKKQKKMLCRILLAAGMLVLIGLLPTIWLPGPIPFVSVSHVSIDGKAAFSLARWALYLIPYLAIAWDVLWRAARNIKNGQIFDENFLMTVATVGAFGCGECTEGVAVMLFYQVGELFQSIAVARSRRSIAALMDIRPDYANVERDGELEEVDPEEVSVGDLIVIKPGERIPLDGTVVEGASALDTAALTGEAIPRDVSVGQDVISGCVNLNGLLRVRVTKLYGESTVSRILELVENAAEKKAKTEHFITRFARYYTPTVVFAALALVCLPPALGMGAVSVWVQRAMIFLVVSCPCALVISIPLSFFGGIGGASRQGILVKGGNYLEALARAGVVVFDKTGTLTRGEFVVTAVEPVEMSGEDLLELAALAEQFSDHPISKSIRAAASEELDTGRATLLEEVAGHGVKASVDGKIVWVGNRKLMVLAGAEVPGEGMTEETVVHLAVEAQYAGCIRVADRVKPGAEQALKDLRDAGIRRTVMLTGDSATAARTVGEVLQIDEIHAGLLPGEKVEKVEQLLAAVSEGEQLVFVGDGINDAPVLSRADIGVAMGAMGSDAAIEAADIVLMDDDLSKLAAAVRIARKTRTIVRQNIVFALGVKFLVLGLSAIGRANMWMAVFADVGVSVIAILNAGRMLKVK